VQTQSQVMLCVLGYKVQGVCTQETHFPSNPLGPPARAILAALEVQVQRIALLAQALREHARVLKAAVTNRTGLLHHVREGVVGARGGN